MSNFPTAPRFDTYGEIRCIGSVVDRTTKKTWVCVKRKGSSHVLALTVDDWLSFAESAVAVTYETKRLSVYGAM